MKSLLAKFSMRRFIGLYLGEHEISVSEVAVTPLGAVEVVSRIEPCPPNELLNVIERILQSLQRRKQRRLQVAIGLPNLARSSEPGPCGASPTLHPRA